MTFWAQSLVLCYIVNYGHYWSQKGESSRYMLMSCFSTLHKLHFTGQWECGTVGTPIFHTVCATPQSVVWCLYKLWNLISLNRLNNHEVI